MKILSIDPGSEKSAIVIYDTSSKGIEAKGKHPNAELMQRLVSQEFIFGAASIERVACYGMPVGREIFDTCFWTGRFAAALAINAGSRSYFEAREPMLIERKEVKMFLCGTPRAKDANIRQAVIDILGEPGTKSNPGKTYGVTADIWAALALALTTEDKINQALLKLA